MKKGNVMFWKFLFLSFIVCFPVQAQENANSVSERNNYELFIIGVATVSYTHLTLPTTSRV